MSKPFFTQGALRVLSSRSVPIPRPHPSAILLSAVLITSAVATQQDLPPAESTALVAMANRGQWPEHVRMRADRPGATLWLEDRGLLLSVQKAVTREQADKEATVHLASPGPREQGPIIRLDFGAATAVTGEQELSSKFHFLLGNDPKRWAFGVPAYGQVRYAQLRPGIDLIVRGEGARFAYDLHVQPGADPAAVEFRCEGVDALHVGPKGELVMATPLGPITQRAPLSWHEETKEKRRLVQCRFEVTGRDRYRLVVPHRDPHQRLVVDPGFDWSTLLGGSGNELLFSVVAQPPGLVTVAGTTSSFDYPATVGTPSGPWDAVVSRLDPNASGSAQLVWSAYIGGDGADHAFEVEVSGGGSLTTIVGITNSTNFPRTPNAWQATAQGGWDGFLMVMGATGLMYSTYVGSPGIDRVAAVEEHSPLIYTIGGYTDHASFPRTPGAYDTTHNGNFDLFVTRLAVTQSNPLVWSTFLGGTHQEGSFTTNPADWDMLDLDVDGSGIVTLATRSQSIDYPTTPTPGAYQPMNSGPAFMADMVISQLDSAASVLRYSTYLGGAGAGDLPSDIAVHNGNVYVAGLSRSSAFPIFPTTGAYQTTHGGNADAVFAVLSPQGNRTSDLVYSTYVGGVGLDVAFGIAVEPSGIVNGGGATQGGLNTTAGAMQSQFQGTSMGFLLRLDPGGQGSNDAHYLSYFGAGARLPSGPILGEGISGIAPLDDGRFVVIGVTDNPRFPTSSGAFQRSHGGGGYDGFVARLDMLPQNAIPFGASTAPCGALLDLQVNSDPVSPAPAFMVICNDGPAGAAGALVIGIASPLPVPVLNANLWLKPTGPLLLLPWMAAPGGFVRAPLPIPPGLSSAVLGLQFLFANPSSCGAPVSGSGGLVLRL